MPLIDLKTDLKSLRFGRDVPGGGTSLYTQNVLQPLTPSYNNSFGLPVEELGQTGGTDFILRGGKYAALGSAKDVSRLTRLFTGTNVGLSFTAKQNILGLTGQDYSAGGPSLEVILNPDLIVREYTFLHLHGLKPGLMLLESTGINRE
jgi:hypothetical protein